MRKYATEFIGTFFSFAFQSFALSNIHVGTNNTANLARAVQQLGSDQVSDLGVGDHAGSFWVVTC